MSERSSVMRVAQPLPGRSRVFAQRVGLLLRLGRSKHLLKSALLYSMGPSLALQQGYALQWIPFLKGLLFTSALHLGTHYCNEYYDLETDRRNISPTAVTGGSRVLVDGELPPWVSMAASLFLFGACTLSLLELSSTMVRVTCALGIWLAWSYTAPPLRLNYRGFGEITVGVVFSLLLPGMAYYLQTGQFDIMFLVIFLPCAIVQLSHSLMMNLLDYESDRVTGKRTLPVILGAKNAAHLHIALNALVYVASLALYFRGMPAVMVLAIWLTLPLAWRNALRVLREEYRSTSTGSVLGRWTAVYTASVLAATSLGLVFSYRFDPTRDNAGSAYVLGLLLPLACFAFMVRNLLRVRPVLAIRGRTAAE
jgi:1,4-dihydroxy-2-naphthoate polyprenyltransferase